MQDTKENTLWIIFNHQHKHKSKYKRPPTSSRNKQREQNGFNFEEAQKKTERDNWNSRHCCCWGKERKSGRDEREQGWQPDQQSRSSGGEQQVKNYWWSFMIFILIFQGFCWESQHVPNSEDWRGENLPEVWKDRWDFYAQGELHQLDFWGPLIEVEYWS